MKNKQHSGPSDLSTERIAKHLQEDILTLICHSEKYALMLKEGIDPSLYDAPFVPIVQKLYAFVDEYGRPPKDSLDTLLEPLCEDPENTEFVTEFIRATIFTKDTISEEYVIDRVDSFILHQEVRKGIYKAAKSMNSGDIQSARLAMQQALDNHSKVADPGVLLGDLSRSLGYMDEPETSFPTGIKELDKWSLGPQRKTLNVFVGTAGKGKTWWLIHLGRMAAMQRYKVLHVTLEVSEKKVLKRYIQAFLAGSGTSEVPDHSKFAIGEGGRFESVRVPTEIGVSIYDKNAIVDRLPKIPAINNIYVKEFPTGALTHSQLVAHIEFLSKVHDFAPDLLIVDYADLMHFPSSANYRLDLGKMYKDLRGIAVERNMAVATASQANRVGAQSKRITEVNIAEDFSKMATADVVMTISQTRAEYLRNESRLYVAKSRESVSQFEVFLSQSYATGQFVMDSCLLKDYNVDVSVPDSVAGTEKEDKDEEDVSILF